MHTFLATPRSFLQTENYLLCKGRDHSALRRPFPVPGPTFLPVIPVRFHHRRFQPHPDQLQYAPVRNAMP